MLHNTIDLHFAYGLVFGVNYTETPTKPPTPTPTPTPMPTPMPTDTPTAVPVTSMLLQAMRTTRRQIEELGGQVDMAADSGILYCQPTVELYDAIVNTPTLDVSGSSDGVRWAYDSYRQAVDIVSAGGWDMAKDCREFLADRENNEGTISFQQWGLARQKVNEALEILIPAIEYLES